MKTKNLVRYLILVLKNGKVDCGFAFATRKERDLNLELCRHCAAKSILNYMEYDKMDLNTHITKEDARTLITNLTMAA